MMCNHISCSWFHSVLQLDANCSHILRAMSWMWPAPWGIWLLRHCDPSLCLCHETDGVSSDANLPRRNLAKTHSLPNHDLIDISNLFIIVTFISPEKLSFEHMGAEQNGRQFAGDIIMCIFSSETSCTLINILIIFVPDVFEINRTDYLMRKPVRLIELRRTNNFGIRTISYIGVNIHIYNQLSSIGHATIHMSA